MRISTLPVLALAFLATGCSGGPKRAEPDPQRQLEVHTELALRYYDLDDLLRAEQQVRKGLELDQENVTLRLMLGWIRQRRGKTEDILVAERVFRSLTETDDYRAHLGLGEALERKGLIFLEASEAVASGKRPAGSEGSGAREVELHLEARAAWDESIRSYQAVLATRPTDVQAIGGLQRVHALNGETLEALHYADRVVDIASSELAFWATQLEREDLTASEETRLRTLVRTTRGLQVATQLHAASLLQGMGRPEAALERLDDVLRLEPEFAVAYSQRAQLLHMRERFQEAIANLDEFLRLSDLEFDHPDIRRAYALRSTCEAALQ